MKNNDTLITGTGVCVSVCGLYATVGDEEIKYHFLLITIVNFKITWFGVTKQMILQYSHLDSFSSHLPIFSPKPLPPPPPQKQIRWPGGRPRDDLSQGGAAFSHTIDLSARLDPHLLPVKFTHLPPSLLSFTAGNSATPGFGGTVGCLRSLRSDPLAVSLYIYEPPVKKRFCGVIIFFLTLKPKLSFVKEKQTINSWPQPGLKPSASYLCTGPAIKLRAIKLILKR